MNKQSKVTTTIGSSQHFNSIDELEYLQKIYQRCDFGILVPKQHPIICKGLHTLH